ncbi:MAG: arginase family protein [Nanoarchaeota archaeon]|nr:arginase family protein [Nanoarchaeota archaeon]
MFIVKIPLISNLGKIKGCEKAPNEILKELKNISSKEQGKLIDLQSLDLEEIHLDNGNIEESNKLVYKNSFEIFQEKPKVVFLGGDHSVSYSLTRAFLDYCQNSEKYPCLIVFDAHADCMNSTKEPAHDAWLRKLIEEGFSTKNILLVGARNLLKEEIKFLKEKNIRTISMNQLLENLEDSCEIIMEFAHNKELYVSIDIDVVDPAFAPATGCPEPGGLSSREFIYIIQRISKMKNLRAVDIVEINPDKDEKNLTVKLAAKVLAELI